MNSIVNWVDQMTAASLLAITPWTTRSVSSTLSATAALGCSSCCGASTKWECVICLDSSLMNVVLLHPPLLHSFSSHPFSPLLAPPYVLWCWIPSGSSDTASFACRIWTVGTYSGVLEWRQESHWDKKCSGPPRMRVTCNTAKVKIVTVVVT